MSTVAPFSVGTSNRSVSAVYSSTCCHPSANVIAVDLSGNTGFCELSAVTPLINIEAETNSAELNLELGKTSKLRFSIRNLGTKGSFTLKASENKYFTGYVAPLNINLDHRQVASSELVITGLKETGSNKTSVVVKAVASLKTANRSQVKLLEIKVTVESRKKRTLLLGWNVTANIYHKQPLVIHYGDKQEGVQITLINNGLAGTFDLKVRCINVFQTKHKSNAWSLKEKDLTLTSFKKCRLLSTIN